jgi:O-antigen/teichoic acid export membrane protein
MYALFAIVQGAHSFRLSMALRIGAQACRIAVLLGLVAADAVSIPHLVLANALVLFAYAALAYGLASRLGSGALVPGRIGAGHLRAALTYGLGIGSAIVQNDGDKLVLNASGHPVDSGLYAAAYRLVGVAMMPASALLSSSHFAVLQASRGSSDQLRRALAYSAVTACYAVPALGVLALLAPWVPRVLGADFEGTSLILQLVAPIALVRALGGYAANGLLGLHRNALRTGLLVAGAAASLVLYLALIPAWSWRGALAASLVSELGLAAACWVALVRCQRLANGRGSAHAGTGPRVGRTGEAAVE